MKKLSLLCVLGISLLISSIGVNRAFAVSAYPFPIEFKQSDGTIIKITLKGDEKVKWAQSADGYTLLYNKSGDLEYALIDEKGDIAPSGILAREEMDRSQSEKSFLNSLQKDLRFSESQVSMMKGIWQIQNKEASKAFPTTGNRKLICILIGFKDKAFSKTKTDFDNLFNQVGYTTGGATGSVKDFYLENSWDQFNLTVDVAGPYTASQNMSYYGANDSYGNDVRPRELVTEAVNFADPTVNFANYDNDGNGSVDGVYIIYAGYGEEAGGGADCIWAHAWSIPTVTKDGKTISSYSCSAELRGSSGTTITSIGVICHEFGHVLGAPDYYDTNYSTGGSFEGTGQWDMMASGSWNNNGVTPAHHNAYTKVKVYGWATATVLSSAASVSVAHAEENASFYQINSTTSGEYWIMENRQKVGFDAYIPGNGLMIYHVHSTIASASSSNNINATYPQKMYPVCASATTNPGTTASSYGSINSAGCPFPGSSSKTSFTDATTPNMKSWAGANTSKPITNIAQNATTKVVTFSFMGGGTTVTVPTVSTTSASSITASSAVSGGNITSDGGASVTARGICYSTSQNPTTSNNTVSSGSGTGTFSASMTGLSASTTYYVRAYATNSAGTAYGSQISFTTSSGGTGLSLPVSQNFGSTMPTGWTTQNVGTSITERWSMSNTNKAGGTAYEAKCTYQQVNPGTTRLITPAINTVGVGQVTLSFKHMLDAYGTGVTLRVQTSNDKSTWTNTSWSVATSSTNINATTVTVNITSNLNSSSTYIALVAEGNLYQIDYWYIDNVSITAGTSASVPTVTTSSASSITSSSATCGGNVTSDGGATITQRGICYSTSSNPTTSNSKVTATGTTGSFTANMTGLSASTTYYVRAYAINSAGTAYGSQISFTTSAASTSLSLPVSQTFGSSSLPTGWTTQNTGTGITERWSMSNTNKAGGSAYELKCSYQSVNPGTTRIITPAVNTVGVSQVTFTFRHYLDAYSSGATLRLQTSNDKVNWTNTSWSVATTSSNITARTVTVTVTTNLNSANTYFALVLTGNLYQIDYWYIDNISITAASKAPIDNDTQLNDNNSLNSFTLFPNPVNNNLNIHFNSIEGETSIKIFDLQGRLVKSSVVNSLENVIDVNDLAKGTYIISVNDGKTPISKRFIKM